ncbi:threonine-phosphate decarboxylase [Sphingobium sp.]|uniref:threonine-phosphate decarboxylase n=1 Tax=Sphingobium sp. TaxID=1912891 RepID=UPI002609BD19|nr:threonine-phosphate decarboxylase [Sphingobium sp.]
MTNPWTYHGGRLDAARRHFGGGDADWIDLSTGINPNPWPIEGAGAIDWASLPDEAALADLEARAGRYFGVDAGHVCALPGTEIGLRMLADMLPGAVRYATPCYRTHGDIYPEGRAFSLDAAAGGEGEILLFANPNNPDGRLLTPRQIDRMLARVEASDGWLVIDEAFADVHPGFSLADRIGDGRRLLIFRSFGKFFGLAGARLGFLLGPGDIVARYRARLGSWPVSAAALAIGRAAYADAAWIDATRGMLDMQAMALDAVLQRHGLTPIGACPLFRLVACADAAALFDRLARAAILTRPFTDQPHWLRFGLPGDAAALDMLDRALADG